MKLAKMQRCHSRKKKGSNRRKKSRLKIAKLHQQITNQRDWFLHNETMRIVRDYDKICIEDLNVAGMVKNHKLAKSISDCSWYEFVRQLEYKSEWYGKNLIKIGRFEPSSKLCSVCGTINQDLTLKDREWTCKSCGTIHDRDINASINIKNIGLDNKIPTERRKSTLGENRGTNLVRLTQEAPAFRQG